jgi:hypothetical protein
LIGFEPEVVPAIIPTSGFFLADTLTAKALSDNSTLWSFQGDDCLVTLSTNP